MACEICWMFRNSSPGEIARAAANQPAHRANLGADLAAVRQSANTNGKIDLLLYKVCHSISKHEPDIDVRISLQKLRDDRQDVQP